MDQDDSVDTERSSDVPRQDHQGIVHSATDRFLNSTRVLVEQVAQAGGAGAQAVVPESVLSSANHMLVSMRNAVESAPQVGAELEIVLKEIRAKRLTIQAITAELAVLDDQLEVLESSLAPLQAWSAQWSKVQHTLLHSLDLRAGEKG
ncbi:hypothetical protein [Nocardioides sediminis]|uniref:hypothetical protein n=1 Tax=Nocardioides sediminis TaxID=433648 RepID=UPI00131EE383|nr:hypothetical protein [Nocardioides sediminis]